MPSISEFSGKRVTVMGLGQFGGGLGATRYLAAQDASVLVTDLSPAEKLADPLAEIDPLIKEGRVRTRLGGHDVADFVNTDLVVANPAVPHPWDNRYLLAAKNAGVPVTTEIQLQVERLPSRERVIGITGSVGKSTTTAMIVHALREAGRTVFLGGNIGGSLLEQRVPADAWVVLELSSFMLHWLGTAEHPWSPAVAVCTNIAPNHLDWHGTLEHYTASKQHLIRHQRAGDRAVLGPTLADWAGLTRARCTVVGGPVSASLTVPGAHNRLNAAVAIETAVAADPSLNRVELLASLLSFPGLEHRLALCHRSQGRLFFNDSKCTTPEAALTAVASLAEASGSSSHVHLIAGGYDKKADLSPVARLAPRLAGLYCIGATGPKIADTAGVTANVHACGTLDAAVRAAVAEMKPGDTLLLSPACASWDQFTNYEHRGDAFVRLVKEVAP